MSRELMRSYIDLLNESLGGVGISKLAKEILMGLENLQTLQQSVPKLTRKNGEKERMDIISYHEGVRSPTVDGFKAVMEKTKEFARYSGMSQPEIGKFVDAYTQAMTKAFSGDASYINRYAKGLASSQVNVRTDVAIYKDEGGVEYVSFNDGVPGDPYLGEQVELEFMKAYATFYLETLKPNLETMRRMANLGDITKSNPNTKETKRILPSRDKF